MTAGTNELYDAAEADALLNALEGEDAAAALGTLSLLARSKREREAINAKLGDRAILRRLWKSDSPKQRKNLARLLGALCEPADLPLLQEMAQSETTLFVIPSILLALGSLGAEDSLRAYKAPLSDCEGMDKHIADIELARRKALEQFAPRRQRETLYALPQPSALLCCAPEGFLDCLKEELTELGFAPTEEDGALRVVTDDLSKLYRAHCLTEALLPVAKNVPAEPKALAAAVHDRSDAPYRIELRGYAKDRARLIRNLAERIEGENSPSRYERELRVDCHMDSADLYWKFWNVPDTRYPWRSGSLPASMQPATAAALARYVRRFERVEQPRVFDPFCGSGTLLFSREQLGHCKALMGVDKSGSAVELARKNAAAGKIKANFLCRDILRFTAREPFDLILSNLPFGNRVGSHQDNTTLYRGFIHLLPKLMNESATALLYTMEYSLLADCIAHEPALTLLERKRTEAGGLLPWVFVLQKAERR